MSTYTYRTCKSEHCGCKTAHTISYEYPNGYDGAPARSWRCDNCGLVTPIRKHTTVRDAEGWTKAQRRMVETIRSRALVAEHGSTAENYEIKELAAEITKYGFVSLVIKTGRKNDEGTLGEIINRTYRHIIIDAGGGVKLANAGLKRKSRGIWNVLHAITEDCARRLREYRKEQRAKARAAKKDQKEVA